MRASTPVFNPGALRHEVDIEQPGTSSSASGGLINAWTTFASAIRAKIEPQGGTEDYGGESFTAHASFMITIRYLSGLTPDMRIKFSGRYFDISNINDVQERGRWMIIMAREGRSHGNV